MAWLLQWACKVGYRKLNETKCPEGKQLKKAATRNV